jgi:hypothetical protein
MAYTTTQIKSHLSSIRKDLLRETGVWNARYKRIFQEVDRLLSSIGNRELSDKEIRDIFAMLHFRPPRKKNPKMRGESIKRAIEKMGGLPEESLFVDKQTYDPIIEGSDRRIAFVDRSAKDQELGYVHTPFLRQIDKAVQSLMDEYERDMRGKGGDVVEDEMFPDALRHAREYGSKYASALPHEVAEDVVSLQDNVVAAAQMLLEEAAAEEMKASEGQRNIARAEMEEALFNPSISPRARKRARAIDSVLAGMGSATMLSARDVNAILVSIGVSPSKPKRKKKR